MVICYGLITYKLQVNCLLTSFENPPYAYPGFVAAQNPTNWTTWSGPPYTNEDATISTNYAFDGSTICFNRLRSA